jgi:hypothetical protein
MFSKFLGSLTLQRKYHMHHLALSITRLLPPGLHCCSTVIWSNSPCVSCTDFKSSLWPTGVSFPSINVFSCPNEMTHLFNHHPKTNKQTSCQVLSLSIFIFPIYALASTSCLILFFSAIYISGAHLWYLKWVFHCSPASWCLMLSLEFSNIDYQYWLTSPVFSTCFSLL